MYQGPVDYVLCRTTKMCGNYQNLLQGLGVLQFKHVIGHGVEQQHTRDVGQSQSVLQ